MRKLLIAAAFLAFFAVPTVAFAACPEGQEAIGSNPDGSDTCGTAATPSSGSASGTTLVNPIGGTAQDPSGVSSVPVLLGNVLRALFGVLGSIALLMFIYGGFMWLTSGGNPEKITTGKNTMVWAVLGIAVIFASYAIVSFIIDRLIAG